MKTHVFFEAYSDTFRQQLSQIFGATSIFPTMQYVFVMSIQTLQVSRVGVSNK